MDPVADPLLAGTHNANSDQGRPWARLGFVCALALAVGVAVWVISRPLLRLLCSVPDDGFYYLQIARNLASGLGPTLDGETTTNGYHPLWMLILTSLAYFIRDREALLRAALLSCFALNVAAGCGLVALLRRWFGGNWGWIAGTAWFLFPWPHLFAVQIVEASLYVLALVAIALAIPVGSPDGPSRGDSLRSLALLGLLLGVAVWARTEAVLLIAAAWPWRLVRARTDGLRGAKALVRTLVESGTLTGVALLTVAPILLYNQTHFGTVSQDSGAMKLLWRAASPGGFTPYMIPLLFGPPAYALLLWPWWRTRLGQGLLWLLGAAELQIAIYGRLFADIQFWYLVLPGVSMFIALIAVVACWQRVARSERRRRWAWGAIALLLLCSLGYVGMRSRRHLSPGGAYPWQRDVYASQLDINRWLPPAERIGCFNAGIPAYFSDRFVTNLDGLVNHQIHPYYRQRNVEEYLRRHRISVVCDEGAAMGRGWSFMTRPLALRELRAYPLTDWYTGHRYAWRVQPAAAGGPAGPPR